MSDKAIYITMLILTTGYFTCVAYGTYQRSKVRKGATKSQIRLKRLTTRFRNFNKFK